MRKFTISPRMQEYEFELIEQKVGVKLSSTLFKLLSTYGGMFVEERNIKDLNGKLWKMEEIKLFSFIYDYLDEVKEELQLAGLDLNMIPIANEETGWLFCVSTEDQHPVYIFKTSNYSGDDIFVKISNSLEEFINSLH